MSDNNGSGVPGNPAPGAGGEGAPAGGAWYDVIPDAELKGFAQTKGWKDPASVVDGYRNLEKLIGAPKERVLKLPEKPDDPGWNDVYSRLGKPEKADGYELKVPDGGDPEFAKQASSWFHEANLTKPQAQALQAKWDAYVGDMIAADAREREQKSAAELTALKSEWGGEFDKQAELGRRAGREFGLGEDQFKAIEGALGTAATLKLFASIGGKMAEPKPFEAGGSDAGGGFGLTKEGAAARINALKADREWVSKYLAGGATERQEMERLSRIVAGG